MIKKKPDKDLVEVITVTYGLIAGTIIHNPELQQEDAKFLLDDLLKQTVHLEEKYNYEMSIWYHCLHSISILYERRYGVEYR